MAVSSPLHLLGLAIVLVIVAHQMENTVHDQMGCGGEASCWPARSPRAEPSPRQARCRRAGIGTRVGRCRPARRQIFIDIRKRQHVGGRRFAAIADVVQLGDASSSANTRLTSPSRCRRIAPIAKARLQRRATASTIARAGHFNTGFINQAVDAAIRQSQPSSVFHGHGRRSSRCGGWIVVRHDRRGLLPQALAS